MNAQVEDKISFIMGTVFGFGVGMLLAAQLMGMEIKEFRITAIEHECAIHDPVTGDFTWNKLEITNGN